MKSLLASPLQATEFATKVLRTVYLTRLMDEKMSKLVRQNKGGTFHLSVLGHELVGAMCAAFMEPGKDWALPYYRDRAMAVGLGCSLQDLFGAFLGREVAHHSGGRMMPEHFSDRELCIPVQSSCVGSQFLQAVGVAKGLALQGKHDRVVYVSAGDGATSQGDFHEALNFACIHKLSVLFVIQDNGLAISVPLSEQVAGENIAHRTQGYAGLVVHDVDGGDYHALGHAIMKSIDRARKVEGPSLVVAKVPRIGAHSSSDDPSKYRTKEAIECDRHLDPLPRLERFCVEEGLLDSDALVRLKHLCALQVEAAASAADGLPFPDPSSAHTKVFVDNVVKEHVAQSYSDSVVIVDAIHHALEEEMRADEGIIVFGQDVAHGKGGVFGVTHHLTKQFGEERCFNTPLAESTIIGLALGMAFVGLKPVAEIQFADYVWTGMNQLMNEMASITYRSNGEWACPAVIRMPYGGYIQGGPYHSQSIEAFLAHCPGLKVVIPSHAEDAKLLLKAAIRDPNPVIFLEHKALYRQRVFCARNEPDQHAITPLGKAHIVKEGSDLTLVVWGMMVVMGVQVAERLLQEGISVEVIDLRTIVPLDIDAIMQSVQKTGKCLVAHEAPLSCGFGAEIAARLAEHAFSYLDAPIMRLGGKECMVPYSKCLEDAVLPQGKDLEAAVRKLAAF